MPKVRIRRSTPAPVAPDPVSPPDQQDSDGLSWGALAGAAALAGAGVLAARNPGGIGKLLNLANSARQQLMLSGLAAPKSIIGNIGAAGIASAERRSMEPLKQLFSKQTADDFVAAWKANKPPVPGAATIPGVTPGRLMGAADEATQGALRRAGLSATEAEREVLQAPLGGQLGEALDSPAARYLIPFRRTPFNQFTEGLKTLKTENLKANPALVGGIAGAGAVHGAATADERYPLTIGLGTAAASRYGLPYAGGALLGRMLAGGKTGGSIAGTMLPVSEYGIESSITDPLQPIKRPALLRLLGM